MNRNTPGQLTQTANASMDLSANLSLAYLAGDRALKLQLGQQLGHCAETGMVLRCPEIQAMHTCTTRETLLPESRQTKCACTDVARPIRT